MKRLIPLIFTIAIFVAVSTISASASVSLSGPSSAESGSTITFSVQASSSGGITGLSATIVPESGLVVESVSGCPSGWMSASNTNAISVAGANAVNSVEVYIKCRITGDPGSSKTLSLSGAKVSDANGADTSEGSRSKTVTISTPKSGDNTLASLSIAGHAISFSPSTTSYSIGTVSFDTKSLSINANANDSDAKVSVSGNSLVVGDNYVKVNVTAPNGSVKTYTIKVTREQDPNYVPGSDGSLSSLTISHGDLSPAFDKKIQEYVVYVPFEVDLFSATGTANAALAKGVKNVADQKLEVGVNEIPIVCTAEDDSKTTYTVYVVRMDEFGGKETIGLPASLSDIYLQDDPAEPEAETEDVAAPEKGFEITPLIAGGIGLLCLLLGFGIGTLIFKKMATVDPEPEFPVFEEPEVPTYVEPMPETTEYEDVSSSTEIDDDVDDLINKYLGGDE